MSIVLGIWCSWYGGVVIHAVLGTVMVIVVGCVTVVVAVVLRGVQ